MKLPLNARVMLLLDLEYGGVTVSSYVDSSNTINSKTIGNQEWIEKVKYMCLINKLTVVIRYITGNSNALSTYNSEWNCFFESNYNRTKKMIRECILSIL